MRPTAVRPLYFSCLIVAAALLLHLFRARANADNAEPFAGFTKYVRYHVHYDVNADGTDVETCEWAMKVLTDKGVALANHGSVSFSDRLQNAEILSAYTLKKDGRRVDVLPSNFQENINQGKDNASPMFSDIKTKTVAFPDVALGDTVVMSYKLTQKEAEYPGNFSFTESFSKFQVYDDVEVGLSAPATLALRVYQRDVEGGEAAPKDGRRNWSWSYRNKQLAMTETSSVSPYDYGPLIVATTFKDYGAVAAAYNARANEKAKVTDRIRKLADEVTMNAHTPREQAKALYEWVATTIEYAEHGVGVGFVVPHEADLVLANRMGDCKDHAALLQALLAAKGIASTPVMMNAGDAYTLPEVPNLALFNHVINYIPAFNLYVDSTSRYTPFGSLPFNDCDKPVIYTAAFNGIRHPPPTGYKNNSSQLDTVMNIHSDGSADGETKVEVKGFLADSARAGFSYLQPNMEDWSIRRLLTENGYTGMGTLVKDDPKRLTESYSYSIRYKVNEAMNLPGPGAMLIRSPADRMGTIASTLEGANEPDRTVNFQWYGTYAEEKYTIHLPKGLEVLATPKNVQFNGKNETYKASYQLKGGTLTVVRELEDRTPGNVCTPKDAAAFKSFAPAVLHDLHAQLLYR